jgi:hypothetical protein
MREAKPVAWRWAGSTGSWSVSSSYHAVKGAARIEPLYSQSDFDAMRAQRDEWEAAAIQARDGCNQRSDTIRSLRDKLATLQAQITRLREAAQGVIDWADLALDNPAEFNSHGVKNLTGPAFDSLRAALSEPSPSNSGDTP